MSWISLRKNSLINFDVHTCTHVLNIGCSWCSSFVISLVFMMLGLLFVIYIIHCRHPLQELCVNMFVPNDTVLDLSRGKMKILTGANASGKSVYLTQVTNIHVAST